MSENCYLLSLTDDNLKSKKKRALPETDISPVAAKKPKTTKSQKQSKVKNNSDDLVSDSNKSSEKVELPKKKTVSQKRKAKLTKAKQTNKKPKKSNKKTENDVLSDCDSIPCVD